MRVGTVCLPRRSADPMRPSIWHTIASPPSQQTAAQAGYARSRGLRPRKICNDQAQECTGHPSWVGGRARARAVRRAHTPLFGGLPKKCQTTCSHSRHRTRAHSRGRATVPRGGHWCRTSPTRGAPPVLNLERRAARGTKEQQHECHKTSYIAPLHCDRQSQPQAPPGDALLFDISHI